MPSRMAYTGSNSLIGTSNPYGPELAPQADIISDIDRTYSGGGENRGLIECLALHESGNDQSARGLAGEIGCMQFMPGTFREYNSRYNTGLSIDSCDDQKRLAGIMLAEDHNNIRHWTTRKHCL